ncbi:hypothetical protein [Cobetia sp. L2A1]|uniref:hypothetical protein n=1 Tax=Cobetia sp. L2A1 TaxID=2686360 RepID=UPI00131DAC27|nr:hypothetical protein [Cobetia sp. L2A1]
MSSQHNRTTDELIHPRMRGAMKRAQRIEAVRAWCERRLILPFSRWWLSRWQASRARHAGLEQRGLPRHAVESVLGQEALTVWVNPRELVRDVNFGRDKRARPSSTAFIWDGEWDLRRGAFRHGSRSQLMRDLIVHGDDLTVIDRYQRLKALLEAGKPWSSPRDGLLLDSEARILGYLQCYRGYLQDMSRNGFRQGITKDEMGVAVSREGRLLKINRGLHRLAMAQQVGVPSVPVVVKAVHREFWDKVTAGAQGDEALRLLSEALQGCRPESEAGPLDPKTHPDLGLDEGWPDLRELED